MYQVRTKGKKIQAVAYRELYQNLILKSRRLVLFEGASREMGVEWPDPPCDGEDLNSAGERGIIEEYADEGS